MKLGKLAKRLKKDLAANPKQAVVLGIVCLVALWFYAPLLMKWFKAKPGEAKGSPPAPQSPVAEEAAPAGGQALPAASWWEIQAWRSADSLTRPATLAAGARDPFAQLKRAEIVEETKKPDGDVEQQIAERVLDPAKLPLVLESIVYGRTRRLAQINGQTVRENDPLIKDGDSLVVPRPNTFRKEELVGRVVAIGEKEVQLEIQGQTVQLRLTPKKLGRDEVMELGSRK